MKERIISSLSIKLFLSSYCLCGHMISKLRGHHLICLNFFKGEGYSQVFVDNLYEVLKKKDIEIVEGPDEVCAKCPHLKDNKCANDEYSEDAIQTQDRNALKLLNYESGQSVKWEMIASLLPDVLDDWKKQYCNTCRYRKVCFSE